MTNPQSSSGWSDPTSQAQPPDSWSAPPGSPAPYSPPPEPTPYSPPAEPTQYQTPTYDAGTYPPPSYETPSQDPYAYPTTTPAYQVQPAYPAPAGYGQQQYPQPTYVVNQPTNGLAIAAMVVSILGFGPVGAIMGHVARKQIRERNEQGDGFALAGIIVGWVYTGIWVLCCGTYAVAFGLFGLASAGAGG